MLDSAIVAQLRTIFQKLRGRISLILTQSHHSKQEELRTMLQEVVSCHEGLSLIEDGNFSEQPTFSLQREGKDVGISFLGIPGGHEFSSLILAILNADGQGKMPDASIVRRIQALKGPIQLRTVVSLSCENCPDVVQNLNLMASLHPDFHHQVIDGDIVPEWATSWNIQGVPSLLHGDTLLSAGKVSLLDLLKKLEEHFGVDAKDQEPKDLGHFDVTVLGGGPAGCSAAIYAARKGLKTALVAERLGGQLQDTKGIENLISVPYIEGPGLSAQLVAHMNAYAIQALEHRRVSSLSHEKQIKLTLDSSEHLTTRALIVATGAQWRQLNIPGEKEYIGRGVAYCPHCDGPYYKGKDIAVIGGGNSGVEAAIDLSGIVRSVLLVEFLPELKADQILVDKLKSLSNVQIRTNTRSTSLIGNGSKVTALEVEDRTSEQRETISLDGVFVQIGLKPNSELIQGLVDTNRFGEIIIDDKCRTSVPGIYAAGDVTTVPYKQIVIAMGEGAKAALSAFEDQLVS